MKDVFGKMFDMDRDGELDPIEREMEYDFMYEPSERRSKSKSDLDDWDFLDEDERRDALDDDGFDWDDDDSDDFDDDF